MSDDSMKRHSDQAEAALRLFRAQIERANDSIEVIDPETGRFLDMNEKGCTDLGYTREEVLGMTVPDINPTVDAAAFAKRLAELRQVGAMKLESVHRRKDGSTFPVEVSLKWIRIERDYVVAVVRDITEWKKAEAVLAQERTLLRTLIDNLPGYIYIKDLQGRYLLSNLPNIRFLGAASEAAVLGKTVFDLFPAEIAAPFDADDRCVVAAGEAIMGREEPYEIGDRHGWFSTTKVPFRDADGKITGLVGITLDITNRKQADEALRESEERFRELAENIREVFWISSPDKLRLIYVSPTYEAVWGRTCQSLYADPLSWIEAIHPEDRARIFAGAHERQATGEYDVEYRILRPDGTQRWVHDRAFPIRNAQGEVVRIAGVAADITAHRQAVEEVGRLAAFPQMNPNPVLELTAEGAVIYCNAAATALAGELGFARPGEMLPPGTADIVRECLATHRSRIRLEVPYGKRIVSWSFYPIPDRGVVHCYAGDVTDQRQLAEQLRQSQKLESVGRLAAGIAHDFNNLLTVIQGYSDILRMELADRPRSAEAVAEIAAAGERAANLTRQLLLFSRKQVAQRSLVDLNELTGNLTKMLGRLLGEDIALRLDCRPGLPLVSADPGMIEQVITNLAVNARDAMPAGGRLKIATSVVDLDAAHVRGNAEAQPGRFVCLTVADTGSGIAPETLAHIFEPFFTTKEVGKGTGLGLATVYGIVMQHQGVVEVTSQPGEGTRFHIYLPAASRAETESTAAAMSGGVQGGNETILLVEDEALVLPMMEALLRRAGYTVLSAMSGVAALAVWKEHGPRIDLLLSDLVMPGGLSGLQLAERLRAQRPGLRVIFMSGYSPDLRGGLPGIEEGINFLQKPFSHPALLQTVRRQLDSRH